MPLNDKEFNFSLSDLPEHDRFNIVIMEAELSGTIIEVEDPEQGELNSLSLFDGYETHERAFIDAASSLKITTTDGEFYLITDRGDHNITTYKVKEDTE